MDKAAIEKIIALSAPNYHEQYGFTFSDKSLRVVNIPQVETMNFHTLRGMVETLKCEIKNFNSPLIVNVMSHLEVVVYSAISTPDRTRETPYQVTPELPNIEFSRAIDYETMMITLKSKFVETQILLDVITLLGTITDENSTQASDDGSLNRWLFVKELR